MIHIFSVLSSSVHSPFVFSLVDFVLQCDITNGCYNAKLNSFFHMCPTALYSRHVVIHSFDSYIYGTIKYAAGRTNYLTITIIWSDLGVLCSLTPLKVPLKVIPRYKSSGFQSVIDSILPIIYYEFPNVNWLRSKVIGNQTTWTK